MKTGFDYQAEFDSVMLIVQAAASFDIDLEFIESTLSQAEGVGPIIDPTAFVRGRAFQNLEDQREVMNAVAPFIRAARRIVEKHQQSRRTA